MQSLVPKLHSRPPATTHPPPISPMTEPWLHAAPQRHSWVLIAGGPLSQPCFDTSAAYGDGHFNLHDEACHCTSRIDIVDMVERDFKSHVVPEEFEPPVV